MWKFTLAAIKNSTPLACIFFVLCFGICSSAFSQQFVIADKDNTHPELSLQTSLPALITKFNVQRINDYIEVGWAALKEQDIRKYVIEYTFNGADYRTAGEVNSNNGIYSFKHHLSDNRPALYRIRMELLNGKYFYSTENMVDGIDVSPVQIYPTSIRGNVININASWPVERISIFSRSGQQIFAKDINGQMDHMSVVIPSFQKDMYWITFFGNDWKTTTKFIVE